MKTEYTVPFYKDIERITDTKVLAAVKSAFQSVEAANTLQDIPNLKKMKGAKKGNFFRIRTGNYRIGFKLENRTVVFLVCANRKDFYKYFP